MSNNCPWFIKPEVYQKEPEWFIRPDAYDQPLPWHILNEFVDEKEVLKKQKKANEEERRKLLKKLEESEKVKPEHPSVRNIRNKIEQGAVMSFNDIKTKCEDNPSPAITKCPWYIDTKTKTPEVDKWVPEEEDMLFRSTENRIYLPIHVFYKNNVTDSIDYFNLKAKRCYNGDAVREHLVHYINYFEKFYDTNHELYISYAYIKYMIDYKDDYKKEDLFDDIFKYVLNAVMLHRIKLMVERNYKLNLNNGKRTNNVSLQYTDHHALLLLNFSMIQKLTIPLVTHFITVRGYALSEINDVLMQFYYRIFGMFKSVNMIAKLYETVMSSVKRSMKKNKLWEMQNIRGINPTTHTIESVENIPLQLSPKYTFNQHIISFNFSAVRKNIGYKVLDISYNYTYVPLSSSLRDEDNNSKIDKYEANLEKTDENMHLFIKANKTATMHSLLNCSGLGQITQDEIAFYKRELSKNGDPRNKFQQELVNLSVFRYFGDPITSKFTNVDEYIAMMIASKRLMKSQFIILPEIICGRVVKLVDRKSVNKKDMEKIKASPTWKKIVDLFRNPLKEDQVLSYIAVILSSEFNFISYEDPNLNGRKIEIQPEVVEEEFLRFILYAAGTETAQFANQRIVINNGKSGEELLG